MKLDKALKRERKRRKNKYGHVVGSRSVFTIEEQIRRRNDKKRTEAKRKAKKEKEQRLEGE